MLINLLIVICAIGGLFLAYMGVMNLVFAKKRDQKERVQRRLGRLRKIMDADDTVNIERKQNFSGVPWLNRALSSQAWSSRWALKLEQAQVEISVGRLVTMAIFSALAAMGIAALLSPNPLLIPVPGIIFGYAPFMWVNGRCKQRMKAFRAQLPDALDLIARALKAGHAFPQGMRMVAEEMEEPIGPEFDKVLDEINFGIPPEIALENLTRRVDNTELRFFVISVNIQRETGGNLAEIVEKIGKLVRERFIFDGKVKVLSAEGRLTAYILVALPFAVGITINFLNPDYMSTLYTHPTGKSLLMLALFQMAVGAAILRKMIRIEV